MYMSKFPLNYILKLRTSPTIDSDMPKVILKICTRIVLKYIT